MTEKKKIKKESLNDHSSCRSRPGVVLLVTLVLLVVLSTLGYTLSSRVAAARHREHYIIDYSKARYGCDSAVKYAIATLEEIKQPQLIARPNEPDFSDLFALGEAEYEEFLAEWAAEIRRAGEEKYKMFGGIDDSNDANDINDINDTNDINDINDVNYIEFDKVGITDYNDPNALTVRGPYGPPWPFIAEPVEFEIGSATVRIEIEDENAKYPLGWALLDDKNVRREALAGLETFCEWMSIAGEEIDLLKQDLDGVSEIKSFKLDFKPIKEKIRTEVKSKSRRRRRRSRRKRYQYKTKTISASEQIAKQTKDFAKLFHSSLIDADALARPTIISESRKESALKYMGMWASSKVNINTAPRNVLEAAFTFGGDADKIAEEIIQRRRIKPFENIEDLRESLLRYSDSIEKCEKYITTASRFFTIRVSAVSGVAKASTVIAIIKDGKKIEKVAILSG